MWDDSCSTYGSASYLMKSVDRENNENTSIFIEESKIDAVYRAELEFDEAVVKDLNEN